MITGRMETFEIQPNGDVELTVTVPSEGTRELILVTRQELAGMAEASAARVELIETCATVGCRNVPTHEITHGPNDVRFTEKVCKECAESYCRRPALRAVARPLDRITE